MLRAFDHEIIVANPRQVKLISASSRKDDRLDAQTLAQLARVDPKLLRPIQHRSRKAQGYLMVIRVRSALVEARTSLVNTARGLAKSLGERLPVCDTDQMGTEETESLPVELQRVFEPLMGQVVSLTEKIKEMDRFRYAGISSVLDLMTFGLTVPQELRVRHRLMGLLERHGPNRPRNADIEYRTLPMTQRPALM